MDHQQILHRFLLEAQAGAALDTKTIDLAAFRQWTGWSWKTKTKTKTPENLTPGFNRGFFYGRNNIVTTAFRVSTRNVKAAKAMAVKARKDPLGFTAVVYLTLGLGLGVHYALFVALVAGCVYLTRQ
jgi:hypothetical protein